MTSASIRSLPLALMASVALAGCTNPDAPTTSTSRPVSSSPKNAGEPPAPAPPSASTQAPLDVQATPSKAIAAFAVRYVNWTYRTLGEHQRTLAAMSVGAARLSERQAAASSRGDTTIARGHIYNRGQIVSIARDLTTADSWVIVTREQTGGDSQYEGLPAAYHVTIAQLAGVPGGYAVEQWLPQG
ncbi:MAG TPA: hypothetical protein VIJ33_03270 [Solirubrobacteraceae bacterium]